MDEQNQSDIEPQPKPEPSKYDRRAAQITMATAVFNILSFLLRIAGIDFPPVYILLPAMAVVAVIGTITGIAVIRKTVYQPWCGFALILNVNFVFLTVCAIFGPALLPENDTPE